MKKIIRLLAILVFAFSLPALGAEKKQPQKQITQTTEQIKIFSEGGYSSDEDRTESMESKINSWLNKHKTTVDIVRVLQSSDRSGYITITIFYKAKNK